MLAGERASPREWPVARKPGRIDVDATKSIPRKHASRHRGDIGAHLRELGGVSQVFDATEHG